MAKQPRTKGTSVTKGSASSPSLADRFAASNRDGDVASKFKAARKKTDAFKVQFSSTRKALYQALAAIYQFHSIAVKDEAAYISSLNALGLPVTAATRKNLFLASIHLVFDGVSDLDDANVSRWAQALAGLKSEGVEPEAALKELESGGVLKWSGLSSAAGAADQKKREQRQKFLKAGKKISSMETMATVQGLLEPSGRPHPVLLLGYVDEDGVIGVKRVIDSKDTMPTKLIIQASKTSD